MHFWWSKSKCSQGGDDRRALTQDFWLTCHVLGMAQSRHNCRNRTDMLSWGGREPVYRPPTLSDRLLLMEQGLLSSTLVYLSRFQAAFWLTRLTQSRWPKEKQLWRLSARRRKWLDIGNCYCFCCCFKFSMISSRRRLLALGTDHWVMGHKSLGSLAEPSLKLREAAEWLRWQVATVALWPVGKRTIWLKHLNYQPPGHLQDKAGTQEWPPLAWKHVQKSLN